MKISRLPPAALLANPYVLWGTYATKSFETWAAAAQVIPIRLTRMAAAGTNPSAADRREMSVMGTEKLDAFSRAGLAFATAMTPAAMNLGMQAFQAWMGILNSGARLAASRTVPQTLRRQRALAHSLVRHGPAAHRGSHAAAKVAHAMLDPVHAVATANAKRLTQLK